MVTLSLLLFAQFLLEAESSTDWWLRPPWNQKKDRPSVLDVERLLRLHRSEILYLLAKCWARRRERPLNRRLEPLVVLGEYRWP